MRRNLAELREHYGVREWGRHGAPLAVRLLRNIVGESETGCWLWGARRSGNGYGQLRTATRSAVLAHRVAYEFFVAPVPDGLQMDHLCRVRHCVNPDHLEPVTAAVNRLRSVEAHGLVEKCRNGHLRTAESSYIKGGRRMCRPCMRDRARARKLSASTALVGGEAA